MQADLGSELGDAQREVLRLRRELEELLSDEEDEGEDEPPVLQDPLPAPLLSGEDDAGRTPLLRMRVPARAEHTTTVSELQQTLSVYVRTRSSVLACSRVQATVFPDPLQPSRDRSTGWQRRRRRSGTTKQY